MNKVTIICNRCKQPFEVDYGSRRQYCDECRILTASDNGKIYGKKGGRPKKK